MNKVKLRFGEPEHKWLPVHISIDDFLLEFEASSIMQNPVEQLIEALVLVTQGVDAEVVWYLEPQEYIFKFNSEKEEIWLLIVEKTKGVIEREVYRVVGDFQSIVLPCWRAIKASFANRQMLDKHWPTLSPAQLQKLEAIIKAKASEELTL
jgi:hypothetical protein